MFGCYLCKRKFYASVTLGRYCTFGQKALPDISRIIEWKPLLRRKNSSTATVRKPPVAWCSTCRWRDLAVHDRRFWDIIFENAQRPILWEVFRQLEDRMTRYNPLLLKLFPDLATRPRPREALFEFLREGKVDEALRAFKKIYLEVVHRIIDHLQAGGCQRGSLNSKANRCASASTSFSSPFA